MEVEVESEDEPGFTMAGADDDTIRFAAVSTITPMRTITTSAPPHIDLTRIRRKNGKIVPITPRNAYMSVPSSGNGSEHEEPNHSQEETTAANIITPTISRQAGPIQLFQTNNASQQSSATVTDATDTTVTTINNANSGSADSTGQRSTLSFSSDYKPGGKPKAEDYDSEGKAILVRACAYYEAKVLGVKGFPDSSTQIGWARKAFRDACRVAEKDYECDKRIERLLKGRGSRIRGDMLRFVEEAVMSTFGFTKDTSKKAKRQNLELYDALSDDMRFAFKDTTNCTGFAENPVFQLILRLACFGQGHDSPGIVFARFFDPVSLETLALFMTQIHHIMRQWSTGIYIRHGKTNPFSETGYTAIHKKHLHELQLWQELNEYVVTQIRKRMYTRARAKSGIDPPKIKSLITGELQDKIAQELAGRTGDTESEREDDENEEEEEGGQIDEVNLVKGEQRSEDHLKRQPFGVVPAISDNGFELFESRAICRYLVSKYGKLGPEGLMPDPHDVEATAKFEQAASIENNNFDVAAGQICLEAVVKPTRGGTTDAERVKKYIAILESKLDGYEAILSKQKYLAGDTLTIADLFHLPFGTAITEGAGYEGLLKRPNVARWWKDISSRPTWQAVKLSA
ncbi:hypothetical protein D9758_003163 [Tetrapyrgos nigripes]|uniref:glutathione transferase n=1 Tax=Tetrapyrgos nigripes TaxID=182062 RepID=A0A8H5GIQ1_9AGAR|nr:hypothetical protein D9758_003163 [Tetrapyrgos nigripes]